MTDHAEVQTPSEQQQHQPPSLPNSPHPKRVKTDDLLNPIDSAQNTTSASNATIILPTMPGPHSSRTAADVAPDASTPTPQPQSTSNSTLPPVSSLLPNINTLPPQNGTAPIALSSAGLPMPVLSQQSPPLLIQKLTEDATTPTRGSAFAAGYDLYASAPLTLQAKSKGLVSTGLSIACPAGTYGRVAPRSGLASKHFLDTGAGVIDADYRGEVKVLLFNFSDVDYEIKKGERVAQLVLERIVTPDVVVVEKLEESVRGAGGFGSTGYV